MCDNIGHNNEKALTLYPWYFAARFAFKGQKKIHDNDLITDVYVTYNSSV